jgi:signal peptidase II
VLWLLYRRTPDRHNARVTALALLMGGALGNAVDRVRSAQGVVDFLDLGVGAHRWPTFNLADVAVTTGAVLLFTVLWREDEEENAGRAASDAADTADPAARAA